jgi:hypothetical protein
MPHSSMQLGTQRTMPYFLPKAAPAGCSATKKAKKRATAVLRSDLRSPMSLVKCADSALPIYRRQQATVAFFNPKAYIRLVKRVEQDCRYQQVSRMDGGGTYTAARGRAAAKSPTSAPSACAAPSRPARLQSARLVPWARSELWATRWPSAHTRRACWSSMPPRAAEPVTRIDSAPHDHVQACRKKRRIQK